MTLTAFNLPPCSGLDLITHIHRKHAGTFVIVLTVHEDEHLFAALAASDRGHLLKEQANDVPLLPLRFRSQGQPPPSARMALRIPDDFRRTPERISSTAFAVLLTPRETEAYGHIGRGLHVHETALYVCVADSRMMTYIKSIPVYSTSTRALKPRRRRRGAA